MVQQARAFGIIFFTIALCARSEAAELGKFIRASSETIVDFYDCGGNLCGKIVSVKDKSDMDTVGKLILDGAKQVASNSWKGDLIDVTTGKRYDGTITVSGDELKLEGCLMVILCSSETWQRMP